MVSHIAKTFQIRKVWTGLYADESKIKVNKGEHAIYRLSTVLYFVKESIDKFSNNILFWQL